MEGPDAANGRAHGPRSTGASDALGDRGQAPAGQEADLSEPRVLPAEADLPEPRVLPAGFRWTTGVLRYPLRPSSSRSVPPEDASDAMQKLAIDSRDEAHEAASATAACGRAAEMERKSSTPPQPVAEHRDQQDPLRDSDEDDGLEDEDQSDQEELGVESQERAEEVTEEVEEAILSFWICNGGGKGGDTKVDAWFKGREKGFSAHDLGRLARNVLGVDVDSKFEGVLLRRLMPADSNELQHRLTPEALRNRIQVLFVRMQLQQMLQTSEMHKIIARRILEKMAKPDLKFEHILGIGQSELTEYFNSCVPEIIHKVYGKISEIETAARDANQGVSGLKWERMDAASTKSGRELKNEALAAALKGRTEFSVTFKQEEWNEFRIKELYMDHFIQSDGSYFKPARLYNVKFMGDDDGLETKTFEAKFGGQDVFHGGLDSVIGLPDPNVFYAIINEHEHAPNSGDKFTTANYGLTCTPAQELDVVLSPRAKTDYPGTGNNEGERRVAPIRIFLAAAGCFDEDADDNIKKICQLFDKAISARYRGGGEKVDAALPKPVLKLSKEEEVDAALSALMMSNPGMSMAVHKVLKTLDAGSGDAAGFKNMEAMYKQLASVQGWTIQKAKREIAKGRKMLKRAKLRPEEVLAIRLYTVSESL